MSQRFVFSYFTALPDMDLVSERILISLWRDAWTKAGLTPIVLSEFHARKHPAFAEFDAAVSNLPSINPPSYDRACFMRWLAVQVAAREYRNTSDLICMMDFDVLPYFTEYHHLPPLYHLDPAQNQFPYDKMLCLHGNCPALVIGTADQFAEVCAHFCVYDPKGATHCSDQYCFEDFLTKNPGKVKTSMDVVLFSEPGWETASCVHFSNSVMGKDYLPKWQHIPKLRPV